MTRLVVCCFCAAKAFQMDPETGSYDCHACGAGGELRHLTEYQLILVAASYANRAQRIRLAFGLLGIAWGSLRRGLLSWWSGIPPWVGWALSAPAALLLWHALQ